MISLNITLTSKGFKKIPHAKKTEEVWRRDKCIIMQVKRRIPKQITAILIQGSKSSNGQYIIGTDDDKLKEAISKL